MIVRNDTFFINYKDFHVHGKIIVRKIFTLFRHPPFLSPQIAQLYAVIIKNR